MLDLELTGVGEWLYVDLLPWPGNLLLIRTAITQFGISTTTMTQLPLAVTCDQETHRS